MPIAWDSYDAIADAYAATVEQHFFAAPARDLVAWLGLERPSLVLDVGTGTGINAAALMASGAKVVACDLSVVMLRTARAARRGHHLVASALPTLPFRERTFEAATLGFVLSHVPDAPAALQEVQRVVAPGGRLAASAWSVSAGDTEAGRVWSAVAKTYAVESELAEATEGALPWEAPLSALEGLHDVLQRAGVASVESTQKTYAHELSTDEFLRSRRVSMASRYLIQTLDADTWREFQSASLRALTAQFGQTVRFETRVNFARGVAP